MRRSCITDPFVRLLSFVSLICGGIALVIISGSEVLARVGGGQSYGGGGGHDGGGGGGAIIWLVFQLIRFLLYLTFDYPLVGIPLDILVIGSVVYYFARPRKGGPESFSSAAAASPAAGYAITPQNRDIGFAREFDQLRRFDPNFSEIVFTDFCYALYAKAHDARARGGPSLDLFSPYLSDDARKTLLQRNEPALQEVKGIIVGAMPVVSVQGLETPVVRIGVMFEANYTEVIKAGTSEPGEMTYYVRERWDFERKRDLLSPPPAQAAALHCPRCGAPLQKDTVGACAFCGTKIDSGEFQWYVRSIALLTREAKGPLLTTDVPEVGTDYPSIVQPGFENLRVEFERNNPEFSWGAFQARAALIFSELQAAWSTLDWERARPHETDNIFQMHQYWIDAYKRQGLRNVLEQCAIIGMQPVKLKEDAFYNAITLRIGARALTTP